MQIDIYFNMTVAQVNGLTGRILGEREDPKWIWGGQKHFLAVYANNHVWRMASGAAIPLFFPYISFHSAFASIVLFPIF